MTIKLNRIKPTYMSDFEIAESDIYLREKVLFEKGKKYLIKANSGHGKTSILNFIYGSNINFDGHIYYNDLLKNNVFELRKTKISYVFQDFKLFSDLTILENIQLKNIISKHKTNEEITKLIDQVSMGHKTNSLVKTLSVGQKQRVAILRALCQPFDFLLLDEPFSHLDKENILIISNIIKDEIKKQNAGLIMTSLGETISFNFDEILNL